MSFCPLFHLTELVHFVFFWVPSGGLLSLTCLPWGSVILPVLSSSGEVITGTASLKSVNEFFYLRFDYMKNLKLSRRGFYIGKLVFSNHMETSGENANSDLFVHEWECSDQVNCLQSMYWSLYRWKNIVTVQKFFPDYTAVPPFAHKDKLSKKTNSGLDLEACSRVRISS